MTHQVEIWTLSQLQLSPQALYCSCLQDTHGWSSEAVQKAAQELNLSPSAASMFERPEAALVMVSLSPSPTVVVYLHEIIGRSPYTTAWLWLPVQVHATLA